MVLLHKRAYDKQAQGTSLLHLSIKKENPEREFGIGKDAERKKAEQRNERSPLIIERKAIWSSRGRKSLLHLSIKKENPEREFGIGKDAERKKAEQRNERSPLIIERKAIWSSRGLE